MIQQENIKTPVHISDTGNKERAIKSVETGLLRFSFFNFFITSLVGLLLRLFPLHSLPVIQYKNMLHAHSHFAFGGWVMPVLFVLIIKFFPELKSRIAVRHLKNISVLFMLSAYGMLFSFPFQGYGVVSIIFSTLSILSGFYMTVVLWKASVTSVKNVPVCYLRAGLVFLVLSSIGPFATAPLIAMGKAGTAIYFNAIYFFLHFQYNGWFTFALLAVLYKMPYIILTGRNGREACYLFTASCIPAYFLSTLWSHPPAFFYYLALLAAVVQLIAVMFLLKDMEFAIRKKDSATIILKSAVFFFIFKNLLQLLSAFPFIADLAYAHRNFIIAYLHMVLLGFISAFIIAAIWKGYVHKITPAVKAGMLLFVFSFLTTEILLLLNAAGISLVFIGFTFRQLLFFFSLFFPVGILFLWTGIRKISI